MEAVRQALAPYYLELKAVHLFAVMAWIWSTAVAYVYFVVPVFKAWRRNPQDLELIALRDWAMDLSALLSTRLCYERAGKAQGRLGTR